MTKEHYLWTKEQIEEFIEKAEFVDGTESWDSCSNHWEQRIYKVGDELFAVNFCNDKVYRKNGLYMKPIQVIAYEEKVTRYRAL